MKTFMVMLRVKTTLEDEEQVKKAVEDSLVFCAESSVEEVVEDDGYAPWGMSQRASELPPMYKDVKTTLASIEMTISCKKGEYRVNFKGGKEETAYYTNDIVDAMNTARAMKISTDAASAVRIADTKIADTITDIKNTHPGFWMLRHYCVFTHVLKHEVKGHRKGERVYLRTSRKGEGGMWEVLLYSPYKPHVFSTEFENVERV
jgi:hypothetical protein